MPSAISKSHRAPVVYHSSALTQMAPRLAFKKRDSSRVAAVAAAADACREKYKAEREAVAEAAGKGREGDSEEVRDARKYERRLLLNRCSASASRLRKEAYCSGLEKALEKLERDYEGLKERVGELEKEKKEAWGRHERGAVAMREEASVEEGRTGRSNIKEEDTVEKSWQEFKPEDGDILGVEVVPSRTSQWAEATAGVAIDFPQFLHGGTLL